MSTTPPAVVESGDFTYDSNTSSAAEMIRALKPTDSKDPVPREIKRGAKGEATVQKVDPVSDAASTLGKRGAEAAAKARKIEAKAKTPKEAPDTAAEPVKAAETKAGEAQGDEDEDTYDTPELKARAAAAVQRATREAAEAKREAKREREARERVEHERDEERRARPVREERPAAETPAVDPRKPKLSDFLAQHETYEGAIEAYQDARDTYREQQHSERQRENDRGTRIVSHIDAFKDRVGKASETDESFLERTADLAKELQPSFTLEKGQRPMQVHVLSDEIIKSEHGPGLMLHFAENPEEFDAIKRLGSRDAILRAVGRIEARLEDAIAGNPSSDERPGSNPEFSKARPPARPVAVSPRIANAEPGNDSSFDEHYAFHEARDKEKRRRSA